jgi:hypothetical protein
MSTEKLSELSKPTALRNKHTGRTFNETENTEPQIYESLYSQEYVSALLEKLKEKDERAIACVNAFEGIETDRIAGKSLGEFLAGELYLNKAEPKQDGSFGFTFSGLAVQLMADCFADQFKSSGAINYLELLFEHAEVGEMTVTMQRVEGLTPAQKLAAAEQRIAELSDLEAHNECLLKKNADLTQQNIKLGERLATPVRLPRPACTYADHSYPAYSRKQVEEIITSSGMRFTVEGDE